MKYLALLFLSLSAQAGPEVVPGFKYETELPQEAWTIRKQRPYYTLLQLGPSYSEADLYDWRLLQTKDEKPKKNCIEWSPILVEIPRCLRSLNKKDPPVANGYDKDYPMGRWEACLKDGKRKPTYLKRYDLRIILDCEQLWERDAK